MARTTRTSATVRMQDDLDAAVALGLEHLVGLRRLLEPKLVCRQVAGAERVAVSEEWEQVVHPAFDVRLPHPDRELAIKELPERHEGQEADVDAAQREGAAAPQGPGSLEERADPVGEELRPLERASDRRRVCLHPDGVDRRADAAPVRELAHDLDDVVDASEVDGLDAVPPRHREPLGHEVDPEHAARATVKGDPADQLSDRAEAPDADGSAGRHVRVLDGLPGRREDVGEEKEARVRRPLGHLDRPEVRHRHAQVLGLASRDAAVEVRVAEQAPSLAPPAVLGRLALGVEAPLAHEHAPQAMLNGITTRSPGAMCFTSAPTSSTSPIGSWPTTSPSFMNCPSCE